MAISARVRPRTYRRSRWIDGRRTPSRVRRRLRWPHAARSTRRPGHASEGFEPSRFLGPRRRQAGQRGPRDGDDPPNDRQPARDSTEMMAVDGFEKRPSTFAVRARFKTLARTWQPPSGATPGQMACEGTRTTKPCGNPNQFKSRRSNPTKAHEDLKMTSKCRVDRILGPTNSEDPGKPAGQPVSICAPVGIRTPNLLIRRDLPVWPVPPRRAHRRHDDDPKLAGQSCNQRGGGSSRTPSRHDAQIPGVVGS